MDMSDLDKLCHEVNNQIQAALGSAKLLEIDLKDIAATNAQQRLKNIKYALNNILIMIKRERTKMEELK